MRRPTPFQVAVHIAALTPLVALVGAALTDNLTVNPIQEATFRTGKTAMALLVASLACTPTYTVFGFRPALQVRRALGLYAFFYALLHFAIFFGLDYGLDVNLVLLELAEKRYILVGAAALLLLTPLALTSTKGWQRRLGKGWKRLHRLVYPAGVLVIFHYIWVQKSDIREPLIWGSILGLLLVLRLPPVRRWVVGRRTRLAVAFDRLRQRPHAG
ncbi:MAG: sulfoxide reductase heme-binding subunit YedZ [Caldilineales bacterium]|nr:sulfoxide reductase heme-binding subunit YedZ [Caldilineales bacterium]